MIVVTIKRTKEKQQHYKEEEWDYNKHQLIPAHYEFERVGYFKKELREDNKSLAKKLKKFAGVTTTESIVEKNEENKFYHSHLIIHGKDNRSTTKTLLRHIGATNQRPEERWIENFKITKTYYRNIDGKWGETFWTDAFNIEGAYEYLQKTEKDLGRKTFLYEISIMIHYIDTHQVLRATGLSRSTLDRAKANKEIKYFKRGSRCLYKIEDIREWIEGK